MPHAGWTSRGYVPHCDGAELVQHIVFATVGAGAGIAGHFGARFLENEEAASIMQDALLHFDGARYRLIAWCVMPNHVHCVVQQIEGWPLARIVHGWKSYTANQINRIHGRAGPVGCASTSTATCAMMNTSR